MLEEMVVVLNKVRENGGWIIFVGMILICMFEMIVGEYDG